MAPMDHLIREYALLSLRVDRLAGRIGDPFVWLLDYRGPERWRDQVAREPDPVPLELLAATRDLAAEVATREGRRATWLGEQVAALVTAARRLAGETLPLPDRVRGGLGVEADWIPEDRFDEAYALLDQGLPTAAGTLRDRLMRWRAAHSIAPTDSGRVPGLVEAAVAETRERTRAIVELPPDISVDCALEPGPFRGLHRGGASGTILVDPSAPFNAADLFYVVAHEGFPGHIAESMLKEPLAAERPELGVRIMPAPAFVISEGLGLHAQRMIFPGDEAQKWLVDNVAGLEPDGSDFATIHHARTILWGAWCNAALLAARGAPEAEVRAYLERWALLDEDELAVAPAFLGPYIFGYYHGWRLLEPHVSDPGFARRLLTDQVTLEEIGGFAGPPARA